MARRDDISLVFRQFHDKLAETEPQNDGQVVASDAIVPGSTLLGYANAGTSFLFGKFATDPLGQNFAVQALPVIIFFASLVSIETFV